MQTPKKPRCSGTMTEAAFRAFVVAALRQKTRFWKPISDCLRKARVRRGIYKCAECWKEVTASISWIYKSGKKKGQKKKIKNIVIDHIKPIVDPAVGFTTFDSFIENAFCEEDNLQAICHSCHQIKCAEEKAIATERRRKEKEDNL